MTTFFVNTIQDAIKAEGFTIGGSGKVNASGCCQECLQGQLGRLDRPYGQGHTHCSAVDPKILNWIDRDIMFTSFRNGGWEVFMANV